LGTFGLQGYIDDVIDRVPLGGPESFRAGAADDGFSVRIIDLE